MTSGRILRPSCILLDANVIITAHELGVWDWVVRVYRVSVPSVVIHGEAQHFHPWRQPLKKVKVDLTELVASGHIAELAASAEEFVRALSAFDSTFVSGLHAG